MVFRISCYGQNTHIVQKIYFRPMSNTSNFSKNATFSRVERSFLSRRLCQINSLKTSHNIKFRKTSFSNTSERVAHNRWFSWNLLIWESLRESRFLSASENVCHAKLELLGLNIMTFRLFICILVANSILTLGRIQ